MSANHILILFSIFTTAALGGLSLYHTLRYIASRVEMHISHAAVYAGLAIALGLMTMVVMMQTLIKVILAA